MGGAYLVVMVSDDVEVEEVLVVLPGEQSVQTARQAGRQAVLEVISWGTDRRTDRQDVRTDRTSGQTDRTSGQTGRQDRQTARDRQDVRTDRASGQTDRMSGQTDRTLGQTDS